MSWVPGHTPNFSPSSARMAAGYGTFRDVIASTVRSVSSTSPKGIRYRSRSLPGKMRTIAPFVSVR
ncbi:MAG: hypothetical protein WBX49_05060 [Candidatus Deferrimicrobiaceae bacterium]